MALVKTILKRNVSSASRRRVVKMVADAAYALNGYAVLPADFELGDIDVINFSGPSAGGFIATYNPATSKVKVFKVGAAGALTEAANNEATLANEIFYAIVEGDQINAG